MMYAAILSVADNRVAKYAEFETKKEANAHVAAHAERWPDAFVVKAPEGNVADWWVEGRTVTVQPPAPPRRMIRKSIVEQRLRAAGKMDAAFALLLKSGDAWTRWYSREHPDVYADDPESLALLEAIGADAETIMAPSLA